MFWEARIAHVHPKPAHLLAPLDLPDTGLPSNERPQLPIDLRTLDVANRREHAWIWLDDKAHEHEWYHYDEPHIIDVTSYDDIIRAIDDGRLDKIIDEHTRYMKETKCEIWNL